jgi:hypothetical protein
VGGEHDGFEADDGCGGAVIHVKPLKDVRPHVKSRHCPCVPRVAPGGFVLFHRAYSPDAIKAFDAEFRLGDSDASHRKC